MKNLSPILGFCRILEIGNLGLEGIPALKGGLFLMNKAKLVAFLFASLGISSLATLAQGQQWGMYGGNPQHTAETANGVQTMNSILWQTPIDLSPPYDGSDLLIHYGCPTISGAGTVVLAVRNGGSNGFPTANDTYQIEGHSLATGATIYTESSDYVDWMPHDWTPTLSTAIDSNDTLYYPGAGGTIYKRASANTATSTVSRLCFYGLSNYNTNQSAYNAAVQIDTPIVVDSNNNIYFGFYVDSGFYTSGSNVPGLKNGIAKITSAGVGSWVSIDSITGDSGDEIQTNCEPAISNDGLHLYAATKQALYYNYGNPKLIELNTSDLSTVNTVNLTIPASTPSDPYSYAYVMDDGTSSPLIGPDGDVYFGVWYQNIERGFMLHYSSDLSTQKTAGAFGWDDTGAIVPASMVPGYSGTSTYLICTKYNNYADTYAYGDGANKIAILDPNATETYTIQYGVDNPGGVMVGDNTSGTTTGASYTTMKEILTVLGITSNAGNGLEGVREWCVNTVAMDVPGKAAIVNSEDGHCYRWDLTTNSLTDNMNLEPPTGEAYTPTLASSDGIAIAVNNATVFAMWDGIKPSTISSSVGNSIVGSGNSVGTINLTGNATGPGATISLSSSDPSLTVPSSVSISAGSNSATFAINTTTVSTDTPVTITASRYGFTATLAVTVKEAVMSSFSVSPTTVVGGSPTEATIHLASGAGSSGDAATITGSGPAILTSPETITGTASSFSIPTNPVSTATMETITAHLSTSTLTATLTVNPASLSTFSLSPASVISGNSTSATITLTAAAGPSGDAVGLSGTGPATLPSSESVPSSATNVTFSISTRNVSTLTTEVITASWNSTTKNATLTVYPPALLSSFTVSNQHPWMTGGVTGTVTLSESVPTPVSLVAADNNGRVIVDTQPTVAAGKNTATFTMHGAQLPIGNRLPYLSTVTVTLAGTSKGVGMGVQPFGLSSLSLSSTTIHAGQSTTLTITTPEPAGAVNIVCNCLSSNASVAPITPTGLVLAGTNKGTVHITAASHVAAKTVVTFRVTLSENSSLQINLTVEP